MKNKLKLVAIGIALAGSSLFLNGCQTAKGFGQDVQSGGQAIQSAATNY